MQLSAAAQGTQVSTEPDQALWRHSWGQEQLRADAPAALSLPVSTGVSRSTGQASPKPTSVQHTSGNIPGTFLCHTVPGCMGVLSQPGTAWVYQLHSVSLLWTSLNTEARTFP